MRHGLCEDGRATGVLEIDLHGPVRADTQGSIQYLVIDDRMH